MFCCRVRKAGASIVSAVENFCTSLVALTSWLSHCVTCSIFHSVMLSDNANLVLEVYLEPGMRVPLVPVRMSLSFSSDPIAQPPGIASANSILLATLGPMEPEGRVAGFPKFLYTPSTSVSIIRASAFKFLANRADVLSFSMTAGTP